MMMMMVTSTVLVTGTVELSWSLSIQAAVQKAV